VLGADPSYGDFELVVDEASSAFAAGLRTGDVLLGINGEPVPDWDTYDRLRRESGQLQVEVSRGEAVVSATLPKALAGEPGPPRIGVHQSLRKVVGIRAGSALIAGLGLERGDTILAIDGRVFLGGDLADFATGPTVMVVQVARDGKQVQLEHEATADDRATLADKLALGPDGSLRLQPIPDTAATDAGIADGDVVEAVAGKPIETWDELREAVEAAGDQPLSLTLRRLPAGTTAFFDPDRRDLPLGERVEIAITPRRTPTLDNGVQLVKAPLQCEVRADGFGDALRLGVMCSLDLVKQSYVTLKRMITGDVSTKNLGGIVRISEFSYRAAQRGPSWFWYFLGLISVNLAFVNLLPIPVLDGGHMLFLLIEKVKGSPVSSRVFGYSQVVGLVFVLLLVLFVTYNDIMRHL
ncbi:MAG: site-2 protease family protein, partial [Planctomycetes bacterium]|nr:site-2 protease family protein [Planctomycetota bacterium]